MGVKEMQSWEMGGIWRNALKGEGDNHSTREVPHVGKGALMGLVLCVGELVGSSHMPWRRRVRAIRECAT